MLCPNCKTENDDSANFCVNCRASLKDTPAEEPTAPAAEEKKPEEPVAVSAAPAAPATPVAATPATPAAPAATTGGKPNFFAVMIAGVLKPMTTFKENLPKFADFKNSAIISLIVVLVATILSLTTTVVGIVRTEKCVENCSTSWYSDKSEKKKVETKWEWDRLEDLEFDWFKNIFFTLLIYVFLIAGFAAAFFAMAKVFKSPNANYGRMLTVVAVGAIPMIIMNFLSPMIGGINLTVANVLSAAATVYSLSIIFVGLNVESGLEGDKLVYLNIASIACFAVVGYILIRLFGESIATTFITNYLGGSGLLDLDSSSFDINKYLDY